MIYDATIPCSVTLYFDATRALTFSNTSFSISKQKAPTFSRQLEYSTPDVELIAHLLDGHADQAELGEIHRWLNLTLSG